MIPERVLFAFALTLGAGLATGIGGLLAFFSKRTNTRFLSVALGFSAGVMLYVSMIEIFAKSQTMLVQEMGRVKGSWAASGAFFLGFIMIAVIDHIVPSGENPHEVRMIEDMDIDPQQVADDKLMRMGLFTALAVAIHNFPEGLVTFLAAMQDPSLGIPVAIAIAIHNIPEGIAVAVPIFYATGSRVRALWISFLSGLSEPLGALIGYILLFRYLSNSLFGLLFASVAGIMVFISLDELLPAAREYGEPHLSLYGLLAGMMVMSVSLLMFIR
jgi:ZIP family zinc transporter